MNAKLQIIKINALSVVLIIIVQKNLMEKVMENVYALKVIMMIGKTNCANSVLAFGIKINIILLYLQLSAICSYNLNED